MDNLINNIERFPQGHPVRVYIEENILIKQLFEEIFKVDAKEDFQLFFNLFNQISQVEKHFSRKENQLFPYLEKYGWTSPSQGMWAFHDQIRAEIKVVRKAIEEKNLDNILNDLILVFNSLSQLMLVEENRLLPKAMDLLNEEDWKEMYAGDCEIGWMFSTPPAQYPPKAQEEYVHPSLDTKKRKLSFSLEDRTHFDEGYLTMEQVNFIFKFLPVDITYVDENDKVVFYNRGDDRVFPRSAGIIGREVKFCHPPKSVDQVLKIL
ncbi:MAG: hemerythrin domain-containing protein, partial [Aliarcobacter sp.]|nr:hemerythrin domain-containing protein [Aliarcobacter sp.]